MFCTSWDFQKAFDSIPHHELQLKLWRTDITGSLWVWFRAYLNSRLQCVWTNQWSVVCSVNRIVRHPPAEYTGPITFHCNDNDAPSSMQYPHFCLLMTSTVTEALLSLQDSQLLHLNLDRCCQYLEQHMEAFIT